jgi:hypothetical protein
MIEIKIPKKFDRDYFNNLEESFRKFGIENVYAVWIKDYFGGIVGKYREKEFKIYFDYKILGIPKSHVTYDKTNSIITFDIEKYKKLIDKRIKNAEDKKNTEASTKFSLELFNMRFDNDCEENTIKYKEQQNITRWKVQEYNLYINGNILDLKYVSTASYKNLNKIDLYNCTFTLIDYVNFKSVSIKLSKFFQAMKGEKILEIRKKMEDKNFYGKQHYNWMAFFERLEQLK